MGKDLYWMPRPPVSSKAHLDLSGFHFVPKHYTHHLHWSNSRGSTNHSPFWLRHLPNNFLGYLQMCQRIYHGQICFCSRIYNFHLLCRKGRIHCTAYQPLPRHISIKLRKFWKISFFEYFTFPTRKLKKVKFWVKFILNLVSYAPF
jgi:hypothetical protein